MIENFNEAVETASCRHGKLTFFKNDSIVSRALREYGEWAETELSFLLKLLCPGDTVLDVGAFVGTHTLAFAEAVGPTGLVYAFEPQPESCELLRRNVAQNCLGNVQIFDNAISGGEGILSVSPLNFLCESNFGGSTVADGPFGPASVPNRRLTVRAGTIDQLQLKKIALMKIDTEGMEHSVLRGAQNTLRSSSCVVSAECNSLESGLKILEFVKQIGYEPFVLQTPAFNSSNYRGNTHNIFDDANEISLILIPHSSLGIVHAQLGPAYTTLKPLATSDDLVLYLLNKPQYKYEVLAQSKAGAAIGVDFWANQPEVRIFRNAIAEKEAKIGILSSQLQSDRELLRVSHAETVRILTNRIEALAADLAGAHGRNASLADGLTHRDSELAEAKAEIEQISDRLNRRDSELAAAKAEIEQTRLQVARLRSLSDSRAAEVSEALGRSHELTARLAGRELEIAALQTKADLLDRIVRSRGWRALNTYYGMRDRLQGGIAELSTTGRIVLRCIQHPKTGAPQLLSLRSIVRISRSGLFDRAWYNTQYPDVSQSGMDPLVHYVLFGSSKGRNPNQWFDTDWYLSVNPDVRSAGLGALEHYIAHGAKEGRNPSPRFDTRWYLEQNSDVRESGLNPLTHFIRFGKCEGRQPVRPQPSRTAVTEWPQAEDHQASASLRPSNDADITRSRAKEDSVSSLEPAEAKPSVANDSAHGRPIDSAELAWKQYEALSGRIAYEKRKAIEAFVPVPLELHSVSEDQLAGFAATLVLPFNGEPQVSIIIPVYNQLKYTLECLASIISFTKNVSFEVIVVDDSSTDRTREIMSSIPNLVYLRNDANLGFIKSCNHAASRASGDYVVFLNNDAQVLESWLDNLLATFQTHPNVGAVGPQVLYPNGRLQEAGVAINYDCSSSMVGLFEDPALARYNSIREVMYVSGVCILLSTAVFRALGGFSDEFVSAYCEDCDISFRLRQMGLRVLYNPNSRIAHHLSVSTGHTDKITVVTRNQQRLSELWQKEIDELNRIKAIAFYLPQYHPIAENDLWWGKGFTEWANVAKAKPNYVGHDQPHLPADLGFYDLRLLEVKNTQIALAKKYGIHGFCYYYYWFDGKKLLEKPLERVLSGAEDSMPFCLAWANENWTRRWDGKDSHILIGQNHSDEDDKAVIYDLMRYFRHPDYITIGGRPLLLVYRIGLFPDIRRTTDSWRRFCIQEGLPEPYLAMVESFEQVGADADPASLGFDASVEFPPHGMGVEMPLAAQVLNRDFRGVLEDYEQVVLKYMRRQLSGHVRFRAVMPRWDNTPRRQNDPVIFENAGPGAYQAWLEAILEQTHLHNYGEERLVFINAWNEWAEGNYLEPDTRYGHAYLEATLYALTKERHGRRVRLD